MKKMEIIPIYHVNFITDIIFKMYTFHKTKGVISHPSPLFDFACKGEFEDFPIFLVDGDANLDTGNNNRVRHEVISLLGCFARSDKMLGKKVNLSLFYIKIIY